MLRTRPFHKPLLIALLAAPNLFACSSSDDLGLHDSHPGRISADGVVLQGLASEAQLSTFLDREPRDWAWAGGQFDLPEDEATLAADIPQAFTWHADPADFTRVDAAGDAAVMTHFLDFSGASSGGLLRVFTTLPQYTPDTAAWRTLVDAAEPITLSLTTGSFVGAELPEDGGPFIGQSLTFTIE